MKFTLFTIIFITSLSSSGQIPYRLNDKVNNFAIPANLNAPDGFTSLNNINSNIIILDFFGTWCVPCVKALPHLSELQEKYKADVKVVLLSTESTPRLEKFINNRQPFVFPVIVDEKSSISTLFAPPSFPYTIVLNKERKIIAITDAAGITDATVEGWKTGKTVVTVSTTEKLPPIYTIMNSTKRSNNKLIALSQDFMYAAKTGDAVESFMVQLKNISYDELKTGLKNDNEKKAFWINAYNGYTQALIRKNPDAYKNRKLFFTSNQIQLAGKSFSLDDIEHGILRRSKIKWSLGHLNKLFPNKTEKELRVDKLDYRLHFALNCGAKSCPPVAFYDPADINTQLDVATTAYLAGEAEYNGEKNTLGLPAIMGWFRRDFGGKKKMLQLVKENGLVPDNATPKIYFNKYDWELHLNNFQN